MKYLFFCYFLVFCCLINNFKGQECFPMCVYGICNNGECLCMQGYTGDDCTKEVPIDHSLSNVTVGIILATTALIGFFTGYSLFYFCYSHICHKDEEDEGEREFKEETIEKWEIKKKGSKDDSDEDATL